jgi:hypothetical protein
MRAVTFLKKSNDFFRNYSCNYTPGSKETIMAKEALKLALNK